MAKISACVIAKNEAANIARCLESIRSVADEIIVVDTGSTDDTVKIATKLGAKVVHYQWINDFAAARNHALEQAKGNWVVFLDADEYIMAETVKNVRPNIEKIHGNRKVDCITCLMEHTDGVGGAVISSNPTVRIFRNSRAIRYKGRIHERIVKWGKQPVSISLAESVLRICHTGYYDATKADKSKRNLALLEEDLKNGTVDEYTNYYLSQTYVALEQYDQAIEYAYRTLDQKELAGSIFDHKPYVFIIQSMLLKGACRDDAIWPILDEALAKFPHHPEIVKCLGNYQHKFGCYTEALAALLRAVEVNEKYSLTLTNDFYMGIAQVHRDIGALYQLMNNAVKALEHYVLSLKHDKYDQSAFDGLISVIRTKKSADVVCLLNSLYNNREEKDVRFLVARLAALKVREVVAYYITALTKNCHGADYTGMATYIHGNFAPAFQLFAAAFAKTGDYDAELLAVAAAFLSDNTEGIESLGTGLKPAFKRIAGAYFRPDAENELSAEDFPAYLDLVREFGRLSSERQLERLLAVGLLVPLAGAPARIAAALLEQALYSRALDMYLCQIDRVSDDRELAEKSYRQAAFCCYKLRNYAAAVDLFARALATGPVTPEVGEYLAWISQQYDNAAISQEIAALQSQYRLH